MNTPTTRPVLEAIARVMADTGSVQKRGKNEFHHYSYATASDIANVLQKTMATHGLIILQHEQKREFVHNDSVLMIHYEFTLAHVSGDVWPEKVVQTGMCAAKNTKGGLDDKAVNKCQVGARKYFVLGLFFIPTGDYPDSDGEQDVPDTRHEPVYQPTPLEQLLHLVPTKESQLLLRDYLRDVPNAKGDHAIAKDGELHDLDSALCSYMVVNWEKVKAAVDRWANQVPGLEESQPPNPSDWRSAQLPFTPKDPDKKHLKGWTLGAMMDSENEADRKYAFGLLMNYKAEPWTDKEGNIRPPSKESVAFAAACEQWRKDHKTVRADKGAPSDDLLEAIV